MPSKSIKTLVHWFYRKRLSTDDDWCPFTHRDSDRLEQVYHAKLATIKENDSSTSGGDGENCGEPIVSTNGGRYDVYIRSRLRKAIYWEEEDSIVIRATWFYRPGGKLNYKPFSESNAEILEKCYQDSLISGSWNHRLQLSSGDTVIINNAQVMMHYEADSPLSDDWSSITDNLTKPGRVWRGVQDLMIDEGESDKIDHLVFVVHGIGEICDLRMRNLVEVVDDFRGLANNLVKSHLGEEHAGTKGNFNRVEFLPISWHAALHGDKTGIDERLKLITLNSIPKLRSFSNDTILDALFYTSPVYCQLIIETVGNELARVYNQFIQRNPSFKGSVSLMGHSLGSLILFDILSNQRTSDQNEKESNFKDFNNIEDALKYTGLDEFITLFKQERIDLPVLMQLNEDHLEKLGLPLGSRVKLKNIMEEIKSQPANISNENLSRSLQAEGCDHRGILRIGQPCIKYPRLPFDPACFFSLGSPISAFLTVRGIKTLTQNYKLPTCDLVYNIFHPYDPIGYRLEPLIDDRFYQMTPIQIPHHKGRKRMHLELRENLIKMGYDIKEKVLQSFKPVWDSISGFKQARNSMLQDASTATSPSSSSYQIASSSDRETERIDEDTSNNASDVVDHGGTSATIADEPSTRLNSSGRVDYVLQEKPIEFFNGYIFALATHTCYWQSEDTALFVLREIYKSQNDCLNENVS